MDDSIQPKSLKVILFDFDGTLADTFNALVKITNRLAVEFGYKPANPEDITQLRGLSSWKTIQQSKISIFKLPFLLKKVREELRQDIQTINSIEGIEAVIEYLKHQGYSLGIITSNSKDNVREFLSNHQLTGQFDFIYSGTTLFGKSKIINKFLRQEKLLPSEVIYVGDETRDIDSSKHAKIKVVAVTWGFNSREILAEYQPDFLIDRPEELIEVVECLQKKRIRSNSTGQTVKIEA